MNRETQEVANALIFSMDPDVLKGMMTNMPLEERTAIDQELQRIALRIALTKPSSSAPRTEASSSAPRTKASSSAPRTKASSSAPRTKASSGAADALHTALTEEMAETQHATDKAALVAVSEQNPDAFVPWGDDVMMLRAVLRSLVDRKRQSDANALALAQHQNAKMKEQNAEMKELILEAKSQLRSAHKTNRRLTRDVWNLECLLLDDTDSDTDPDTDSDPDSDD